jgi:hypothetical protein
LLLQVRILLVQWLLARLEGLVELLLLLLLLRRQLVKWLRLELLLLLFWGLKLLGWVLEGLLLRQHKGLLLLRVVHSLLLELLLLRMYLLHG